MLWKENAFVVLLKPSQLKWDVPLLFQVAIKWRMILTHDMVNTRPFHVRLEEIVIIVTIFVFLLMAGRT